MIFLKDYVNVVEIITHGKEANILEGVCVPPGQI